MAGVVAAWAGRALPDSSGYRLVRAFRDAVHDAVLRAIAVRCAGLPSSFEFERMPQIEGPVWTIASDGTRTSLLIDAARTALAGCGAAGPANCPWGEINRARIAHPLSRAIPALAWILDMPEHALPGGTWVPRVQKGLSSASERFAVSPGHEESGYFHMPGGQSGHPLSRFYRAGHDAWVTGEPTPFLPGPARHRLVLSPTAGP